MNCRDCGIEIIGENIRWINRIKKIKSLICLNCYSKKHSKAMIGKKRKAHSKKSYKKASVMQTENWKNKKFREKMLNSITQNTRDKLSKKSIKNWQNKEYRKKLITQISKNIKNKWKEKDFIENIKNKMKGKNKGKIPWNKNKKMTEKQIELMKGNTNGKGNKGKKATDKARKNIRLGRIKYIESEIGCQMTPTVGRYEKRTLDILEENFGYKIERQYTVNGYFLDGYCRMFNLAIEIDEPKHKKYIKEDRYREEQIKKELYCQFLRIEVPV